MKSKGRVYHIVYISSLISVIDLLGDVNKINFIEKVSHNDSFLFKSKRIYILGNVNNNEGY